jgi:hypothetical protein
MVRPPALSDPPQPEQATASAQPGAPSTQADPCPVCGAELAADQEWCVECGAARTAIQPPPDWRIGLAIMLAVVAVVVLVVVIVWP